MCYHVFCKDCLIQSLCQFILIPHHLVMYSAVDTLPLGIIIITDETTSTLMLAFEMYCCYYTAA